MKVHSKYYFHSQSFRTKFNFLEGILLKIRVLNQNAPHLSTLISCTYLEIREKFKIPNLGKYQNLLI